MQGSPPDIHPSIHPSTHPPIHLSTNKLKYTMQLMVPAPCLSFQPSPHSVSTSPGVLCKGGTLRIFGFFCTAVLSVRLLVLQSQTYHCIGNFPEPTTIPFSIQTSCWAPLWSSYFVPLPGTVGNTLSVRTAAITSIGQGLATNPGLTRHYAGTGWLEHTVVHMCRKDSRRKRTNSKD